MKVLHARCAGLDVHKELVMACARLQRGATVQREQRRFETTTKGLLELGAWLAERECTHAAMEATGVYWKEAGLARARRPGRAGARERGAHP